MITTVVTHRSPCSQVILNLSHPLDSSNDVIAFNRALVKERENFALDRVASLLQDQFLVGITFCVKGVQMKAHRAIVTAVSPDLSTMFQHNFQENRTRTVNIEDTKPLIFKQLLQYLYTGTATEMEKEEVAIDLLVAADKYGVATHSKSNVLSSLFLLLLISIWFSICIYRLLSLWKRTVREFVYYTIFKKIH